MVMKVLREGVFAGILKYLLFGFLGLSIVGLILLDVGSSFSNSLSGNNDVAVVEGHKITITEFDQVLRRAIQSIGLTPQQAHQFGYTKQILAGEVRGYLAMTEAENIGVFYNNQQIKNSIAKAVKPILQEGQTMQQALELALREKQMTEKQFVKGIKRELTGNMVVDTVRSGFFASSNALAEDILSFQSQTRDVDLIVFNDSEIKDIKTPSEDQLLDLYDSFKDSRFKIPEYRILRVGVYEQPKEQKPVEVTDVEVEDFYNQNLQGFAISEQKVITQALLSLEDEAQKIVDITNDGKTLEDAFKQVKGEKATGLTADMRLETEMMLAEMRDALENTKIGGIVGPLKTPLGVHVLRLDGVIPPMTKPLADVKEEIRNQLAEEKKMQVSYDVYAALEDHFLQGGTIADAKSIAVLKPVDFSFLDANGLNKEGKDGFTSKEPTVMAMKSDLLKAGFEILQDDADHTRLVQTPDGNFMVIELVEIAPESYKAYETVKADIQKQFEEDQRSSANSERVSKLLSDLNEGKTTFEKIASENGKSVQKIKNVLVSGNLSEPLNDEIRPSIFKEPVGSYLEFHPEKASAIIYINGFSLPELTAEQKNQIDSVRIKMEEESKDEAVLMYLNTLGDKYVARVNSELLDRAYGGQQTSEQAP